MATLGPILADGSMVAEGSIKVGGMMLEEAGARRDGLVDL